ncbi:MULTISPECIES: hypothetical protein [Bradyrhizobium]|uniref:hypothetical protein n=1 Tax=Bradyrhizobium TaxID=374 RepID=UPI000D737967|nr:hypothetical protein [Bradyrhizobium diazoefficiens]AWO91722.1 hypothetical protein DI395_26655 [Bradyrhizobium diazoefficiens]MBP1092455.1 hypothetical protein [Bradyrhizobium japonicum]
MPALSDPTLQTKGRLTVGLNLDNNASYISSGAVNGLKVTAGALAYGPPNAPPPPWKPGKQYWSGNGTAFGAQGMVPTTYGYTYQAGIYQPLYISDMSSNAVMTGKTYVFTFSLGTEWIQLYLRVTGGPDGATVLPGFGLWSLGSNPHAWTYVTPEAFTGEWMIGLLSPACFNIVWLSVEYAPPKDYGGGLPEARLCFKVSGLSPTNAFAYSTDVDLGGPRPLGQHMPIGLQHLHPRSQPHILQRESAVPVG